MTCGAGKIKKMLRFNGMNMMQWTIKDIPHKDTEATKRFRPAASFLTRLITVLVMIVLLTSCSRSGGVDGGGSGGPHVINDQDTVAPVVTIATPATSQVFTSGNTISMTGTITDETGLYRGSVKLIDDATGDEVKQQLYEIHGFLAYNFTVTHTAVVTAPVNYTVVVSFEDHGLNATTRSVKIKVNP
jgi:hypothetical protein